jgi:SAM-dependent methyltransferase
MTEMQRHKVFRSDRIRVTEDLFRAANAKRVLEVGAGDYSFDYTKGDKGVSWTKTDFEPPCDVICNLNSERLNLPFDAESFDLAICTEILEHLLWPQRLLAEVHRALSADGKVLVSVPNIVSLTYRIAWMIGRTPSCAASGNLPPELGSTAYAKGTNEFVGGHVIDFNLSRILRLLALSGFAHTVIRGSGIIWHKQLLPSWIVPASLASNIIVLARKT